jgi:uncharacterized protein YecA (UPF0149 family)
MEEKKKAYSFLFVLWDLEESCKRDTLTIPIPRFEELTTPALFEEKEYESTKLIKYDVVTKLREELRKKRFKKILMMIQLLEKLNDFWKEFLYWMKLATKYLEAPTIQNRAEIEKQFAESRDIIEMIIAEAGGTFSNERTRIFSAFIEKN